MGQGQKKLITLELAASVVVEGDVLLPDRGLLVCRVAKFFHVYSNATGKTRLVRENHTFYKGGKERNLQWTSCKLLYCSQNNNKPPICEWFTYQNGEIEDGLWHGFSHMKSEILRVFAGLGFPMSRYVSHHPTNYRGYFISNRYLVSWLVVWLPFFVFPYIGLLILPIDEVIFFRGVAQPPTSWVMCGQNPQKFRDLNATAPARYISVPRSSLADVFMAKAEGRAHIPFRNSKLSGP